MKRLLLAVVSVVLITSACGGGENAEAGALFEAIQAQVDGASEVDSDDGEVTNLFNPSDVVTPEGSGELAMNSFRIGEQVWMRTLPMASGQCWVTDDDANGNGLPASTNVSGRLDGDDSIKFRTRMDQQGEFDILVDDQRTFHWLEDEFSEIAFTHDYDNNIVRGSGIFRNFFTGERAHGSFVFQCDPTP